MRNVCVVAKVLAVRNLYSYPCCSNCRRKLWKENDKRLCCPTCKRTYQTDNIQYRYYVRLNVADGSGIAIVTIFGRSLQAIFGLTATRFSRYVSKCENEKFLQDINVAQIVHLSMEKCLVGSIVHLMFPKTTSCRRKSSGSGSPFPLRNIVLAKQFSNSEFRGNYYQSKPQQLLASCISRMNSREQRTVVDIFTDYIKSYKEASTRGFSDDVNTSVRSIGDVRSYLNDSSCGFLEESSCDEVIESPLVGMKYHTGTDLVLSMDSDSNDSRDEDPFILDNCEKLHARNDSEVMKISHDVGRSPKFSQKLSLGDLQQSFVYPKNLSIPQVQTEFTELEPMNADTPESFSSNCSCNDATHHHDSSTTQTTDSETKSRNAVKLGDNNIARACDVTSQSQHASQEHNNTKTDISEYTLSVSPIGFDFDLNAVLDSPSTDDIDAFLADMDSQCFKEGGQLDSAHLRLKETFLDLELKCGRNQNTEVFESRKRKTCCGETLLSSNEVTGDRNHCSNSTSPQAVNKDVYSCSPGVVCTPEPFSPDILSKRCFSIHQPCLSSTPIARFRANYYSPLIKENYEEKSEINRDIANLNESQILKLSPMYKPGVTPEMLKSGNDENHHCGRTEQPNVKKTKFDDHDIILDASPENDTYCCSPLLFSQT